MTKMPNGLLIWTTTRVIDRSRIHNPAHPGELLTQGANRLGGALDIDALEDYFSANPLVMPGLQNRITLSP
ncbi:MAG: hypothetical protein WCS87_02930 [Methylococcaceae bacterium]